MKDRGQDRALNSDTESQSVAISGSPEQCRTSLSSHTSEPRYAAEMLRQTTITLTFETPTRGLHEMVLGTWQGIYLWERRLRTHRREVILHLLGE